MSKESRYFVRYSIDGGRERSFTGTLVERNPGQLVFQVDGSPHGRWLQNHWIAEMTPVDA